MKASASRHQTRNTKIAKSWTATLSRLCPKRSPQVNSQSPAATINCITNDTKSQVPTSKEAIKLEDNTNEEQHQKPTDSSLFNESDAQSFTLFPELPTEIQLTIWGFAAFLEPRIINVIGASIDVSGANNAASINAIIDANSDHYYIHVRTPLPSIFGACHDSREVALQYYKTSFEYSGMMWPRCGVRCNPTIDTLFFDIVDWSWDSEQAHDFHIFNRLVDSEDLADTRHIAAGYKNLYQRVYTGDSWNGTALLKYANLETCHRIYYDQRP